MNPILLKTFLAVTTEGSFSRAARLVHISQSTVSAHVRQLEEDLGTDLIDRGPPVRPTAAGRVLVRYASRLLRLAVEAEREIRAGSAQDEGEITIAAESPAVEEHLPRLLAGYHRARPTVRVTVQSSTSALASVLSGQCDLAFLQGPIQRNDGVAVRSMAHVTFEVVGAPNRVGDRFVSCPPPFGLPLPEGAESSIRLASVAGARCCVLEGAGLALLSRDVVAEDVRAGKLEVVPWPGTPIVRTIVAAHAVDALAGTPALELLDLVGRL